MTDRMTERIDTGIPKPQDEELIRNHSLGPSWRERLRSRPMLAMMALVVGVSTFWLWQYYSARESTDDAQVDGHIHSIGAKVGGGCSWSGWW